MCEVGGTWKAGNVIINLEVGFGRGSAAEEGEAIQRTGFGPEILTPMVRTQLDTTRLCKIMRVREGREGWVLRRGGCALYHIYPTAHACTRMGCSMGLRLEASTG